VAVPPTWWMRYASSTLQLLRGGRGNPVFGLFGGTVPTLFGINTISISKDNEAARKRRVGNGRDRSLQIRWGSRRRPILCHTVFASKCNERSNLI